MGLLAKLLAIDPELDWTLEELDSPRGGENHFGRYLGEVLEVLGESMEYDSAYAAIAGLVCGKFTPFIASKRSLLGIRSIPTSGGKSEVANRLESGDDWHVLSPTKADPFDPDIANVGQRLLIKLVGHGELFGFICIDKTKPHRFSEADISGIAEWLPSLMTLTAEENFSMRVREIASPIAVSTSADAFASMCRQIVERTARAFACDGTVLRIYDPDFQLLVVEASEGEIDRSLLTDRMEGEGICGKVFIDPKHTWAVPTAGVVAKRLGMGVAPADELRLRELGIESFIVMRIQSESKGDADDKPIGTLSYFFRRPHKFSYRDISLFRTYCQRVGDAIALHRQTLKLLDSYEKLRRESTTVTRVEIIQLIAHDLFHKSFNTCRAIQQYVEKCRKGLNSRELHSHAPLEDDASQAIEAATRVQAALEQLRSLQTRGVGDFETETDFDLTELLDEIEYMLSGALARNKITIKRNLPVSVRLHGARAALSHILYNLVINSIDAARERATTRPMTIHVQAKIIPEGNRRKLTVTYWDEGPGIDRNFFRDPSDVFKIGRTTKPTGTGTGLPVARLLLTRYFKGNLRLIDPSRAVFEMSFLL